MKVLRKIVVKRRLEKLRLIVKIDSQKLRSNLIKQLNDLFRISSDLARTRTDDMKERQGWIRVAAYTAQVMEQLTKGYDERQVDKDLEELARMVDEVEKIIDEARAKNDAARSQGPTENQGAAASPTGPG